MFYIPFILFFATFKMYKPGPDKSTTDIPFDPKHEHCTVYIHKGAQTLGKWWVGGGGTERLH